MIGPIMLKLYASSTDDEIRGWLRGTHRGVAGDPKRPWSMHHPHARSAPLSPGKIYEFDIPIVPTANLFRPGSRIKLKIASCDDTPAHSLEAIAAGHIRRQSPSRITVHHNEDYPSALVLPVTSGNVIGTYVSGGKPYI